VTFTSSPASSGPAAHTAARHSNDAHSTKIEKRALKTPSKAVDSISLFNIVYLPLLHFIAGTTSQREHYFDDYK
jgi:hypothetical protein